MIKARLTGLASAAVSRACTILSKNTYQAEAAIACVNEDICSGCGICKTVCSYNAIEIVAEGEKSTAQVTDPCARGAVLVPLPARAAPWSRRDSSPHSFWPWLTRHWSDEESL